MSVIYQITSLVAQSYDDLANVKITRLKSHLRLLPRFERIFGWGAACFYGKNEAQVAQTAPTFITSGAFQRIGNSYQQINLRCS
jgi:hypothetical protein